jgi:hypothetical protein
VLLLTVQQSYVDRAENALLLSSFRRNGCPPQQPQQPQSRLKRRTGTKTPTTFLSRYYP